MEMEMEMETTGQAQGEETGLGGDLGQRGPASRTQNADELVHGAASGQEATPRRPRGPGPAALRAEPAASA